MTLDTRLKASKDLTPARAETHAAETNAAATHAAETDAAGRPRRQRHLGRGERRELARLAAAGRAAGRGLYEEYQCLIEYIEAAQG